MSLKPSLDTTGRRERGPMPHELVWGTPSELQRTTQWDAHEPGHG